MILYNIAVWQLAVTVTLACWQTQRDTHHIVTRIISNLKLAS